MGFALLGLPQAVDQRYLKINQAVPDEIALAHRRVINLAQTSYKPCDLPAKASPARRSVHAGVQKANSYQYQFVGWPLSVGAVLKACAFSAYCLRGRIRYGAPFWLAGYAGHGGKSVARPESESPRHH